MRNTIIDVIRTCSISNGMDARKRKGLCQFLIVHILPNRRRRSWIAIYFHGQFSGLINQCRLITKMTINTWKAFTGSIIYIGTPRAKPSHCVNHHELISIFQTFHTIASQIVRIFTRIKKCPSTKVNQELKIEGITGKQNLPQSIHQNIDLPDTRYQINAVETWIRKPKFHQNYHRNDSENWLSSSPLTPKQ